MTDTNHGTLIVPALRYEDARAAIDFLCQAFGFERHLVVEGAGDQIEHAQLVLGTRMVMLSSKKDGPFDRMLKLASEAGGCTQTIYVIVDDADAHHTRAAKAGAEVVMPLEDAGYGGRGYTCKDLEGNLWTFGTYNPWTAEH